MSTQMKKRVYGIIGISSKMANWNADFSGYPKVTADGTVFGSDKALKFPMKKMWEGQGEKVIYIKSWRLDENKGEVSLIPRTLRERYDQLFPEEPLEKAKSVEAVLKNLFTARDIKQFGATFAEAGFNLGITGAVQIGQGLNKYEGSEAFEQPILSPFRDPKAKEKSREKKKDKAEDEEGEEAKNSTLGTKIISNEAHYFYSFSINPRAYRDYVEMGVTEGYTEEDYREFKKAALYAATSFATNAKIGCETEFALFVETEETAYLPCLSDYITFEKGEEGGKDRIRLCCPELLNASSDKILSAEVHFNPYSLEVERNIDRAGYYNLFTGKEV